MIENSPGKYDFPPLTRGDTFRPRVIATLTQDGDPLALTFARLQIRSRKNKDLILHEWITSGASPNATITGAGDNSVTLGGVTKEETAAWLAGNYIYDLEVTFASDDANLTILAGEFPVKIDVSHNS
jgi:hypothetical protein